MKNASLVAAKFISLLPEAETPSHTEGYEGFYHLCAVEGDETKATVVLIIRDHDREKFENRKVYFVSLHRAKKTFVLQQAFSRHNIKQAFCLWLCENVRFTTGVFSP